MCHSAPWLSALNKQMWLQFAPKKSKAIWDRAFHTLGPAAEKLLSPKMLWVGGTTQVLSLLLTGRSQPTSSAISDKLNVIRQVLRSLPRQQLVTLCQRLRFVYTARSSYASAVLGIIILSVCLSVTHALWRNKRTYCRYFDITWKGNII